MYEAAHNLLTAYQDQFDDYRESTIGAAFLTQTIALDENTTVKFEIWDTAGQERYKVCRTERGPHFPPLIITPV